MKRKKESEKKKDAAEAHNIHTEVAEECTANDAFCSTKQETGKPLMWRGTSLTRTEGIVRAHRVCSAMQNHYEREAQELGSRPQQASKLIHADAGK